MTGSEALNYLSNNKTIRRKSWPINWFVWMNMGKPVLSDLMQDETDMKQSKEDTRCIWAIEDFLNQLMESDWEVKN